jgi:hypothetical protein
LYRRLLIKGLIHNAFKIITVSNFAKKMIESYDIKASNKIFVIKNSIDKRNIINISTKKIQKSILLVTGFHPQKNLQNVLPYILKKLKGFSIFIVGISFENLSKIVKKNILKLGKQNNNIKIYNFLDKKNLKNIYLRSEIFLMPSIYESFSIPLLEACYFRNIILCSNTGATKETTKNKAIYYNNQNLLYLTKKINSIAKLKNSFKKKILNFQYRMLSNNDDFILLKDIKMEYQCNKDYEQTKLKTLKESLEKVFNANFIDDKKIKGKKYTSVMLGWKYNKLESDDDEKGVLD